MEGFANLPFVGRAVGSLQVFEKGKQIRAVFAHKVQRGGLTLFGEAGQWLGCRHRTSEHERRRKYAKQDAKRPEHDESLCEVAADCLAGDLRSCVFVLFLEAKHRTQISAKIHRHTSL